MRLSEEICNEFATGDLGYMDAIAELEALGFDPMEAERLIDEIADYGHGWTITPSKSW
jgi:hypothetical protein